MISPWPRRRTAFSRALALFGCVALLPGRLPAAPPDAAPPDGLSMELRLPKTRFYLGEIIPATLVFRNDSARKYHLWIGTYDRSGRIPDISFEAVGEDGRPVPDLLKPYLSMMGGGIGNDADLGRWEITLPANQWLSFDRPGHYRLQAKSRRVVTGSKEDVRAAGAPSPQAIPLASQTVDIQIDALTPAQEQEVLVQARADLASGSEDVRRKAAERLRYLQTPAAREILLPLTGESSDAYFALACAPDRAAEADRLLAAVASGRLALQPNTVANYTTLKVSSQFYRNDNPEQAAMIDAVRAWLRTGTWNAVAQQDLAELLRLDPHDAQARAVLAVHQMELDAPFADRFLEQLSGNDSPSPFTPDEQRDFLPLIRHAANPPRRSGAALRMFARLAPDEAHKLIVDAIQHPPFGYRHERGGTKFARQVHYDLLPLCALPDGVLLPELDDTLRRRLRNPKDHGSDTDEGIEATVILTARYGTPALLPDLLRTYLPLEGKWDCEIEKSALRFWMRCDPTGGVKGIEGALRARKDTGCYHTVLVDVLQDAWHDEALPVVLAALDDPSEEVWLSAAEVLARHAANPEVADRMIAAAERLGAQPLSERASDHDTSTYRQDRLVSLLLQGGDWQLTRPQLTRLLALPNDHANTRRQIEPRLAGGAP